MEAGYDLQAELYKIMIQSGGAQDTSKVDPEVLRKLEYFKTAGFEYEKLLSGALSKLARLEKEANMKLETAALNNQKEHLSDVVSKIYYVRRNANEMAKLLEKARDLHHEERAKVYFEELKPLMEHIRKHSDALECVISDEYWDLPKYREMLFIK